MANDLNNDSKLINIRLIEVLMTYMNLYNVLYTSIHKV